ncbi:MAG: hypothetical protein KIT09_14505 [Bryobacteraceae bacterium]|nr:hypothetical protein [Bryobacteraceae bacterium]
MEATFSVSVLLRVLVGVPGLCFLISYCYLAIWHGRLWLWDAVVHENGRLTLGGSLFYFDHFLGCSPMAAMFALCVAGGCTLGGAGRAVTQPQRARGVAAVLLIGVLVFLVATFVASVHVAGWERTQDYLYQRVERDGVISKGGNWNQLQLSNVPIALGILSVCVALTTASGPARAAGGLLPIGLAAAMSAALTGWSWNGWEAFLNPRWLAHSIRELATYPLTGVPLAVAGVVVIEYAVSGARRWTVRVGTPSAVLLGVAVAMVAGQFIMLRQTDVLAIAQRPSFAPLGLSLAYLLASHVFEHFLDFVFLGVFAGGVYALLRARQVQPGSRA